MTDEPRCHSCIRNVGRFFDELHHRWYCLPCVRLMVDTGISTEKARRYDTFLKALRPKSDA